MTIDAATSRPPAGASVDCAADGRRARVREQRRNGVDAVEAGDDGRTLTVTFLGKAPRELEPANIRIDGGRRVTGIRVVDVRVEVEDDPELDDHMYVTVDRTGDASTYTLCVVEEGAYGRPGKAPYPGFDPRYACADFVFHPGCPTGVDCAHEPPCPPPEHGSPVIDYKARDYQALRRQLLDRMTLTAPDWVERHAPDLGVTLVELLAYVGDQLSYRQDAVATEAYLDTARLRTSVRRHVRLIDYAMHDGCNARAWVALQAGERVCLEPGDYRFAAIDLAGLDPVERPDLGAVIGEDDLRRLPPGTTFEVFEPLVTCPVELHPEHNTIGLWTWGGEECCLPEGATSATLRDEWVHARDETAPPAQQGEPAGGEHCPRERALRLSPGDVIVIEEVLGPRTGVPADADPRHRQAVRITAVTSRVDELYDQPVVEVTWDESDALTFPVCLSTRGGPDCELLTDVSVARGNVVLADHGRDLTHCGGDAECFDVPPAEVDVPDCDETGPCGDRPEPGVAVAAIHARLAATRDGHRLIPAEVAELGELVGEQAIERAGLDAEAAATGQAAALQRLLAQLGYPPVRRRFRPVLRYAPVTQAAQYPDPEQVSRAQARQLAAIPGRARAWMEELWRRVGDGHQLTGEETEGLRVLFGPDTLTTVGLTERPARALAELATRFDTLLGTRLDRLHLLAGRARAGTVLGPDLAWEVAQTWGRAYVEGLDAGDPALAGPAAQVVEQDPRQALPAAHATAYLDGEPAGTWMPRRDLLASGRRDRHFVGELGNDGHLALRFGDGRHGLAPPPAATLAVAYRVGNGTVGNVGPEAINHLVRCGGCDPAGGVTGVRNPLAAAGGTDPEPMDAVRQLAPLALRRTLLRAVTADDYAELAARVTGVRRAAAELRWTGTGYEVHVAADPEGEGRAGIELIERVAGELEPYRRIGHDVVVRRAVRVPVDLALTVCVEPGHQRGRVRQELRAVLGNGVLPGGRLGFFHPDARGFGEPVRLSRVVAAAAAVPGVASVQVTRLRRQHGQDTGAPESGLLELGPLEVAQLDNDPARPENGRLSLDFGGSR